MRYCIGQIEMKSTIYHCKVRFVLTVAKSGSCSWMVTTWSQLYLRKRAMMGMTMARSDMAVLKNVR